MKALPVGLGLAAGAPPPAPATRTPAARMPSQRADLPLMFSLSTLFVHPGNAPSPTAAPPRHDRGDAVPLTGFRQGERISVTRECYRHAPWGKDARSLGPPAGRSTC